MGLGVAHGEITRNGASDSFGMPKSLIIAQMPGPGRGPRVADQTIDEL